MVFMGKSMVSGRHFPSNHAGIGKSNGFHKPKDSPQNADRWPGGLGTLTGCEVENDSFGSLIFL